MRSGFCHIQSHWAEPLTLIKHNIHFISQAGVNFSCWQRSNISCVGNGRWSVPLETKPFLPWNCVSVCVCVHVCVYVWHPQFFLKVTGRTVTPKCGVTSSECVSSPLTSPAGSPNAEHFLLEVLVSADEFYVTGCIFSMSDIHLHPNSHLLPTLLSICLCEIQYATFSQ